jgi:hypothetical protein
MEKQCQTEKGSEREEKIVRDREKDKENCKDKVKERG